MKNKENIVVFSAHSDDFVLGAGGTIAYYQEEGHNVTAIVFSGGEKSHPWMKESIIKRRRIKETEEACKILRCKTISLGLKDGQLYKDYQKQELEKKLLGFLEKNKPSKIFTHSNEDLHPDHKALHTITVELWEKSAYKPELYIYSIWNPVSLKTNYPTFYVNISKYFFLKLKALRTYKSQQIHISYPFFVLLFHNIIDGLKMRTKFAEKFYRIK